MKIKTALISVFDKTGILELAHFLQNHSVQIVSTGGTYKLLKENDISTIEISEFTGFPEMMDGRVKTLHPKIHGGLLANLDKKDHVTAMLDHNIQKIDLVIVNLYPFEETINKTTNESDIIEKIDIGGPSMLRSAAKNYLHTTVITGINDYSNLQTEIINNNGETTLDFRKNMARKVFMETSYYDSVIANWFNNNLAIEFPEKITIPCIKHQSLRYGENPHQKASFYAASNTPGIHLFSQIQGKELSYNNLVDSDAALKIVLSFGNTCCAIIKHATPCAMGVSENNDEKVLAVYNRALSCDATSAFGGIVAFNRNIDKELADKLVTHFYEVIIAPSISPDAAEVLLNKKNLRILVFKDFAKLQSSNTKQIKSILGGLLLQDEDNYNAIPSDLTVVSSIKPTEKQLEQLLFAFNAVKFIKSNSIVITHNSTVIAIGGGQTSRVEAVSIACLKMSNYLSQNPSININDVVLASDAFFPFADNIDIINKSGIKYIIAPSGSMRDEEVIEAVNKYGLVLVFAKTRHFKH